MYYMYLVARHSGNDEFNAAYAQEDGGSFTSDAFIWAGEKIQDWVEKGYFNERATTPLLQTTVRTVRFCTTIPVQ